MRRRKIYKILFFAAWILVVGGIASLLIAANGKRIDHVCKGIIIEMKGESSRYIKKEDILKTIQKVSGGTILNKPVGLVNLPTLEKTIEKNQWIQNAELYFDSKDQLNISVWERTPIARVFTWAGTSFYIDSFGQELNLLPNEHLRLQVVTGFTPAKKWNSSDSAQFIAMKEVVNAINADPFWNAQIGQIDINRDNEFVLVPVIGDHIIKLGNYDNVEDKLHRLYIFYKQVMSKTGFNKYAELNVQFKGQVVGVKKGAVSNVDSIQLQQSIENLLKSKEAEAATEEANLPAQDSSGVKTQPNIIKQNIKSLSTNSVPMKTESNPIIKPVIKKENNKVYNVQKKVREKDSMKEPKAVMEKRIENDY